MSTQDTREPLSDHDSELIRRLEDSLKLGFAAQLAYEKIHTEMNQRFEHLEYTNCYDPAIPIFKQLLKYLKSTIGNHDEMVSIVHKLDST